MKRAVAAIVLLFVCGAALAHTSGSSFLALRAEDTSTVHAEWDFDVRDLQQSLQLDADRNGALTWGEIIAARSAIEALVLARTHLSSPGGACTVAATDVPMIAEHGDGPYLRFIATFSCPPGPLMLDHSGWFAFDAGHRALLEYEASGGARTQAILASGVGPWQATQSRAAHLVRFLIEGMRHLVTGYDHLAFLGVLLLALARRRRSGESTSLPLMLKRAFAVITAFTLAHSLTLGLAATGHIRLPSQPVEVAIALSVMIAALLNLSRGAADHGWKLAFAFGLVHGLGFAGALAELASGRIDLFALAAFNVGIETAQLVIAGAAVPLIWWLFRGLRSERVGVPLASVSVACVAAVWVGARLIG
ncbi:MAG TPA: HupE/UreJ family protein [Steroidobacteraceae bacterium]|nr:HupE/UreJ family protein [Steroidobacteraceae bacterium]